MRISSIRITDFRNYAKGELCPCDGVTVLWGDNAQGKTALLESVVLACTGRSHRTPRDRELIRYDQPFSRVQITAARLDGTHEVEMILRPDTRKTVKVNGKALARTGELMGHISGVLFAPEDLRMVKDGPGERRRFMDMELSQIRPSYYYALQSYQRALLQRNRLLRDIPENPALRDTLPEWEAQLARFGEIIMRQRAEFLLRLSEAARENHLEISGGKETLAAIYAPALEGFDALPKAIAATREKDIRRGTTTVGPHRDDILITLNGTDARSFGSQGQQRTAALSMKLAELDIMRAELGESPVLMLDDVMSELDPGRRRLLLSRIRDIQTIVTCTDPEDLSGAQVGASYRIVSGEIVGEGGGRG